MQYMKIYRYTTLLLSSPLVPPLLLAPAPPPITIMNHLRLRSNLSIRSKMKKVINYLLNITPRFSVSAFNALSSFLFLETLNNSLLLIAIALTTLDLKKKKKRGKNNSSLQHD